MCGDRHEAHQGHRFASNVAANKTVDASNKMAKPASNSPNPASNAASNKHQRWDKRAYNAYMRMYMKVLRAVKAGRADWWPRRVA